VDNTRPGVAEATYRRARSFERGFGWALAGIDLEGLAVSAALHSSTAHAAASGDWPPFILVAGLLPIGLVADDDRLFAFVGHQLARLAGNGVVLFVGALFGCA
jgi:di/tricarboxylate transporter